MFDKADKYTKCEYCDGYHHVEDVEEHERHIEVYHKDKKKHNGGYVVGEQCWEDEILYHGADEHWFNDSFSIDGKENVRKFAKENGIKVIRDEYLLDLRK